MARRQGRPCHHHGRFCKRILKALQHGNEGFARGQRRLCKRTKDLLEDKEGFTRGQRLCYRTKKT